MEEAFNHSLIAGNCIKDIRRVCGSNELYPGGVWDHKEILQFNTERLEHIYIDPHNTTKARMKLHYGDLTDASSLRRWIDEICPDEVYNLAAQSHVGVSFETYDYTADMVATEALSLLEAVRVHIKNTDRKVKHYYAGSSEMLHSCLSEAEIVLYKEFQVMCRELKVISQIAEPVYSASVLENVECGVFDEAAMIDEERDGYLHTLVLNLGDPIQYTFRKGKCKVAKIPLPDKPAILELNAWQVWIARKDKHYYNCHRLLMVYHKCPS